MDAGINVLVINPGSTSTKVAVYKDEQEVRSESIKHPTAEIKQFSNVWEQYDYRKQAILGWLQGNGFSLDDFDVLVCRGGTSKPISGGIYEINEEMLADLHKGLYGSHACNVGCQIAYDFGQETGLPVVTLDAPATDELCPLARYSGHPLIKRRSSFHALNQKATARKLAADLGTTYDKLNLVVVHLGGGISVGAHHHGRVVDANDALEGDGPFAPERSGSLPGGALVRICFSGQYSQADVMRMINGGGGLVGYLGTSDGLEVERRIDAGDEQAREVLEAMAYQIAKEIASKAAVLAGNVDAIALTGSFAYSKRLVGWISKRVSFIAPIHVYPGENEMEALALGALRYMRGEEETKTY